MVEIRRDLNLALCDVLRDVDVESTTCTTCEQI